MERKKGKGIAAICIAVAAVICVYNGVSYFQKKQCTDNPYKAYAAIRILQAGTAMTRPATAIRVLQAGIAMIRGIIHRPVMTRPATIIREAQIRHKMARAVTTRVIFLISNDRIRYLKGC